MMFTLFSKTQKFRLDYDIRSFLWKKFPASRKYLVHELVKSTEWTGRHKSEIEFFFGRDRGVSDFTDRWSYYIETRNKKRYDLIFDFEADQVTIVRYRAKNIGT